MRWLACLLLLVSCAHPAQVDARFGGRGGGLRTELFWVTGGGSVDSYIIYCGTSSGSYNQSDDVGAVTNILLSATTLTFTTGTTYYCVVRSVLAAVESDNSNEICFIYRGPIKRADDC